MRIQLLSPAGEIHRNGTGIFKTALRYAPLTLTTLAALVPGRQQHRKHVVTLVPRGASLVDQREDELVRVTLHADKLRERADPLEHLRGSALRARGQQADRLLAEPKHRL